MSKVSRVMKHKNSHLLVGYWSRLRRGRQVPFQGDIDPRDIKRLLSYVFILDCENPARPVYRLAGTALCERFGFELKGTSFLAHWESRSSLSLTSLLQQALKAAQPICLSSIAATADNGMVELETILTPVSLDGGAPTRFFGMVQMLGDPTPLLGRSIAYERLMGTQLIQEDEPLPAVDLHTPPPPPPPARPMRSHPKAPYLRLVVSRERPRLLNFGSGDLLENMLVLFNRWHAANNEDLIRKL
ncbi:MAG TPA: PAS domain-containing protein [Rhizomicrobium sp.]|nr:PAS domain-containing protein [Rhizomicrobium sp.]